jgi:hypothetical protein
MAFVFDVSGSMGKGDYPWHDETLKWNPVTQAARAFLEGTASEGFLASMTFFPAEDDRCADESYLEPDVPFTPLPSTEFGEAFDAIRNGEWRGGTPTLHVMRGVLQYVRTTREQNPGLYVIVLVTDGYPQGCDDNDISSVVAVAADAAADDVPTYVVGIANPPINGAPETVSDLHEIAGGGGTEKAFIIDTGDPEQTAEDFNEVVDAIRGLSVACTFVIPEMPDGREFDKKKVRVVYTSGQTETELVYDADCNSPDAWRYDDTDEPTQIVLCDTTCATITNDPEAVLDVEFVCYDLVILI